MKNQPFRTHAPLLALSLSLLGLFTATSAMAQPAATMSTTPSASEALAPAQLARALQQGGYVVYLRHAVTDTSRSDAKSQGDTDCDNQRVLSPAGRGMASTMAQPIKALKLRRQEVLSSPLCRTMDTATLALGAATPTNALREIEGRDYAQLRRLMTTPVARGSNRWLVGHGAPLRLTAGGPVLAEGEAVVLRPAGSSWTVVARLQAADWANVK
jgi:phosphohistidine phosphatase SixA